MQIAADLIAEALAAGVACRAVGADSFRGEHDDLRGALRQSGLGFVMPSNHPGAPGSTAPRRTRRKTPPGPCPWGGPDDPGGRHPVTRTLRDGHTGTWWATDAQLYGIRHWIEQSYKSKAVRAWLSPRLRLLNAVGNGHALNLYLPP